MVKTNNGTMMEDLIKKFREVHEKEHKIWFTIEEIEDLIKKFEKELESKKQ
jgi:hypothetical protein